MSSMDDQGLLRVAISIHEWIRSHRAPRGGVELKKEIEHLLQDCLNSVDREGYVSCLTRSNLHKSMALIAVYVERLRSQ